MSGGQQNLATKKEDQCFVLWGGGGNNAMSSCGLHLSFPRDSRATWWPSRVGRLRVGNECSRIFLSTPKLVEFKILVVIKETNDCPSILALFCLFSRRLLMMTMGDSIFPSSGENRTEENLPGLLELLTSLSPYWRDCLSYVPLMLPPSAFCESYSSAWNPETNNML